MIRFSSAAATCECKVDSGTWCNAAALLKLSGEDEDEDEDENEDEEDGEDDDDEDDEDDEDESERKSDTANCRACTEYC
jgi:hypothetical protein